MKTHTPSQLGSKTSKAKKAAAKRNAKLPRTEEGLQKFIRDPAIIWYGPHQCNKCGCMIVKSSFESGGLALDAGDYNHHYPNFPWRRHLCIGGKIDATSKE